jgi:CheY-like chemotaxis protein/signal recognition particle receptor subunit beta
MALFNHATKEVTAKLVYYGPGLCGKTTNLQWIHDNLTFKTKGKLVSLATQTDRTLFFDFLPVELGTIRGMRTRMQIYTVPGQVFYEATRRMVLKGCDAVVFVADSQAAMLDANAESQRSLRQNLLVNEIDPQVPQVIQYNKRDLPTALPISVLNERLNPRNLPSFEAIAFKGTGVEETLKGITKLLFQWLSRYYGEGVGDVASESAGRASEAPKADSTGRVMIRVPHATLGTPEPAKPAAAPPAAPKPAAPPAAAPPRPASPPASAAPKPPAAPPKPPTPPVSARPLAPATPEPEDELEPTIRLRRQQPAPVTPPAAPVTPPAAPAPRPAPPAAPPAPAPPAVRVVAPAPPPPAPAPPAAPPPAASVRPTAPAAPQESEIPSTIVFKKREPPPVKPTEAEVPIFIDEEEEAPPATIVFAKSTNPQPAPAPPVVVAPAPVPPPPAPPPPPPPMAPPSPAVVAKPQPVVVPGAAARPAATAHLPPGMSAPAPKPEAKPEKKPATPAAPADPPPKGDGLRSDQWLYLLDGAQRGPIDVEDLIDLVLTSIPENTKVWHPGLEGWVLANQVRQIAEEIPPPIPIPGLARSIYGDEEMPDFNTVPPMLRSVLIADEDAAFRKYLAMPLAAQGFTIYEAADGSAAWQLAVQNRPWMILADISMPELDGFEFCRRVRSHPMLSRLPLLFISGSDKYKERYRALQIGADDFLSKNMPVRELLMRIQLLMTRYSDLSASEPKAGAEEVAGAFQGRIEVFGAPALLQMCAQGRLTGLFTSLAEDTLKTATVIGFREGDVISAACGEQSNVDAVYAFLAWTKGSFKFTPGDPGEGEPLAQSVEHLLLEGCRLLDEANKGGGGEDGAAFA